MIDRNLMRAVAAVLAGMAPAELAGASDQVRARYRSPGSTGMTASDAEALSYLAIRLPATAAAMGQALVAVDQVMPGLEPSSQLDIGAGAGAAAWAARAVWPSLTDVALREHDPRMIRLGKRLAAAGDEPGPMAKWSWQEAGIIGSELQAADVVTAGYVLGELDLADALAVAREAWRAARKLLVVVGPGTPAGFELIRAVRHKLLGEGAVLVAPCPHDGPCPIESPDWCHFTARVERSPLHRHLKGGRLGYEDEKFSYVAVARTEGRLAVAGRVLRHPVLRRRLVELQVCCDDGALRTARVGHSKAAYREARSLRWGDVVSRDVFLSVRRADSPRVAGEGGMPAAAADSEHGAPRLAAPEGGAAGPADDDGFT